MSTTAHTTNGESTQTAVTFQPYVFFYGRCEEALEFYRNAFGGSYEIMRVKDAPEDFRMELDDERVMHASFTSPGVSFLCSDGREDKTIDPEEGNVGLAFAAPDQATGERIVSALADGGSVKMPLGEAFWGGRFANVVDKFGNEWMITTP